MTPPNIQFSRYCSFKKKNILAINKYVNVKKKILCSGLQWTEVLYVYSYFSRTVSLFLAICAHCEESIHYYYYYYYYL